MTFTDLFRVIIRLFGLYTLTIWATSLFIYVWSYVDAGFQGIAYAIGMSALYFAFSAILIFKADTIIRWLRLDRGYEQPQVALDKLTAKSILQVGAVLLGGYQVLSTVAHVLVYFFSYIQASASNTEDIALMLFKGNEGSKMQLVMHGMNLLIGFLLVSNADRVARWLAPVEDAA